MSDSLQPRGLQHTRLPCPSPTPRACSNSRLSSWQCHPTISSSVIPFSSCLQSFPASGSFPKRQLFTSGGQRIEISVSVPQFIQLSFAFYLSRNNFALFALQIWLWKTFVIWTQWQNSWHEYPALSVTCPVTILLTGTTICSHSIKNWKARHLNIEDTFIALWKFDKFFQTKIW